MRFEVLRETKQAPAELQEAVARAGGSNIFGQPNFRVVWGWSRLTIVGGWWDDYTDSGRWVRRVPEYREIPKYFPVNRWHVEKWLPPEFYGPPEAWPTRTREVEDGYTFEALGPYPSQGEYEHCFTLQDPKGYFLELSHGVCRMVVRAVECSRHLIAQDKLDALYRREAKREHAWDTDADAVLHDAGPAFHGAPHIVVPSLKETLELGVQRSGL